MTSSIKEADGSFSDVGFVHAVDALLWISPSGDHLDLSANYKAVAWSLEERRLALEKLRTLVSTVLPSGSWRAATDLAAPLLEAHLFLEWLSGNRDNLKDLFCGDEADR